VFQLPPPVVEARVPISFAPGCTGCARTGVGTDCASATCGGADFAGAGGDCGGCDLVGAGGGEFCAIWAGGGDVDFAATNGGVVAADADAFGVGFPFANLPFGVGVAFAPFPFGCTTTIGGGVTALAGSTRTS